MSQADDVLDGGSCQECGRFMGACVGYPRTCSRCRSDREAIARWERMAEAQQKELTPSMTQYNNDTHVIRIIGERNGELTCTVRLRGKTEQGVDVTITFPKKPKLGVVWTFMSGDRLSFLAFAPTHSGIHR